MSRAPSEGSSSGAGRRARRCDAPHWFVNFDRASIVADLAEKCRLNNKKDATGGAIENLRSCYLGRGGSLSASVWKSNFGRPTPSTRCCPYNYVCSMT